MPRYPESPPARRCSAPLGSLFLPSRALLLSEVVTLSGEHHLVLVVRLKDGDLVLDNLNDDIRLVAMTYDRYLWIRVQSPQNPKFWLRASWGLCRR